MSNDDAMGKLTHLALAMFNGGTTKIDVARYFNVTRQTISIILQRVRHLTYATSG